MIEISIEQFTRIVSNAITDTTEVTVSLVSSLTSSKITPETFKKDLHASLNTNLSLAIMAAKACSLKNSTTSTNQPKS